MEDIYLKIGSILLGLIIAKVLLDRLKPVKKNSEEKLTAEYLDILNNPEYKVKGKST